MKDSWISVPHRRRIAELEAEVAALKQQVAMDTQRFKEMEQHGLGLEAEVAALKKAIQDEVEALSYVDHAGVRHITHPTTRTLAALLEGE